MAPVYGMAATVPFRGLLSDLLKRYMDPLYKVKPVKKSRVNEPGHSWQTPADGGTEATARQAGEEQA